MRITGIVFLLSLIAANPASAQAGKSLDDYLSRLEALGWSGAAVVVRGDDVLLQKGYGLRDPDTGARVTTDTVFTLGSIAKPLTATAVMKLESRGALATSDPITKYFKGVPEDKKGITLHHLLTHTAGLPAALGHDFDVSLDRVGHLKLAMNSPLRTPPGDRYAYSNVGFTLLAMIVEIVSEQPFETFLRKEVLLPAGMTRTGYFAPKYKKDELCVGYRDGKRWGTIFDQAMRDDGPSWHLRGNGGIHTTIGDMLKWHRALEKNTVISKATQAKMLTPYADEGGGSHYGYGWSLVKTVRGSQLAAHNGGNPTFSADFRRYLDEGVMTFVASARSEFFVDPISHNLASIVFGHRVAWPPKVTALSAAALKALCGTYAFEEGAQVSVKIDGTGLDIEGIDDAARRLLTGGAESAKDGRIARTLAACQSWSEGDIDLMHALFKGAIPKAGLSEEMAKIRKMREGAYGHLEGMAVEGTTGGRDRRIWIAMKHAKGSGLLRFDWEGDEVVGLEPVRSGPQARFKVSPVSATQFVSFSLRGDPMVEVRFDKEGIILMGKRFDRVK